MFQSEDAEIAVIKRDRKMKRWGRRRRGDFAIFVNCETGDWDLEAFK